MDLKHRNVTLVPPELLLLLMVYWTRTLLCRIQILCGSHTIIPVFKRISNSQHVHTYNFSKTQCMHNFKRIHYATNLRSDSIFRIKYVSYQNIWCWSIKAWFIMWWKCFIYIIPQWFIFFLQSTRSQKAFQPVKRQHSVSRDNTIIFLSNNHESLTWKSVSIPKSKESCSSVPLIEPS